MKTFKEAIYSWVEQNFGPHEAQDPSWDIESLAEHLSEQDIDPDGLSVRTKHEAYDRVRQGYIEAEVADCAFALDVRLTDEQIESISHALRKSSWYNTSDQACIESYIREELRKGEQQ